LRRIVRNRRVVELHPGVDIESLIAGAKPDVDLGFAAPGRHLRGPGATGVLGIHLGLSRPEG
jgi:hypothetical protein